MKVLLITPLILVLLVAKAWADCPGPNQIPTTVNITRSCPTTYGYGTCTVLNITEQHVLSFAWGDGASGSLTSSGQGQCCGTVCGYSETHASECLPEFFNGVYSYGNGVEYLSQGVAPMQCSVTYGRNCEIAGNTQQFSTSHTCSTQTASGCTTPGIGGGCPPGTSPDGFGWWCPLKILTA